MIYIALESTNKSECITASEPTWGLPEVTYEDTGSEFFFMPNTFSIKAPNKCR